MRNLTGSITVSREFQPRFTRCSTVSPRYAFAEGDSRIRRRRWHCNGIGQDRARASALSRDRTGKKAIVCKPSARRYWEFSGHAGLKSAGWTADESGARTELMRRSSRQYRGLCGPI